MVARLAQTFTIPSSSVNNSTEVYVSSVVLYCKQRPGIYSTNSGVVYPGAKVYFIPTSLGNLTFVTPKAQQVASLLYDEIVPSIDATLTSKFNFPNPVNLQTDVVYAIVIDTDDPDMLFWTATVGEVNINVKRELSSLGFKGSLYNISSNLSQVTPIASSALKFQINVCRYFQAGVPVSNVENYECHIDNLEYVTYDIATSSGSLFGGEILFPLANAATGTASVVQGSNSIFCSNNLSTWYTSNSDPMYIAIQSGNSYNVRRIINFRNTQAVLNEPISFTNASANFYGPIPTASMFEWAMPLDPTKKFVILENSTANSTVHFSNNQTLIGEVSGAVLSNCQFVNYTAMASRVAFPFTYPAGTSLSFSESFLYSSNDNGNSFFSSPTSYPTPIGHVEYFSQAVALPSRSNEVQLVANASSLIPSNTSIVYANVTSTQDFVIPINQTSMWPVYFTRYHLNNDYTNENGSYGNAVSKATSTVISLAPNQYAEDLKVYLNAYRPTGTDLKVFAKFYNSADSDAFVDKDWTLMTCTSNAYSSTSDSNNVIELDYSMNYAPNTSFTMAGQVTVSSGSSNVVASSPLFASNIAVGDLVKIYSPLFANIDFFVASVVNVVNSTVITIDQSTSNASLLGSGLSIDVLGYPHQAFLNTSNNNTLRYYNSTMSFFDTFNSFAIKIVFLSSNNNLVPYVSSCRALSVSA